MYRNRMRPVCSPGFPTLHQLSSGSIFNTVPRHSNHPAVSSASMAFRTSIFLALLIGLSISLCGCGGYVLNPQTSASPSGSSRNHSPSLSTVSCGKSSITGPQTEGCSVFLTIPAVNSFVVNLSSNNESLSVPKTVTVAPGSKSAKFNAVAKAVTTTESVILTATAHRDSHEFVMQLNPPSEGATARLGVSSTTLSFGNVLLGNKDSLPLTLTSTGTASVTISGATLTGTGFSVSGISFPITLSPSQTATLAIQFDPAAAGPDNGQLTIASSTGSTVVSLTGTGETHEVKLTWDAPTSTSDTIAGYHVYRSPAGTSSYQLLSSSVDSQTTYLDPTVQSGQTYDYVVKSIDDAGVESAPSNITGVIVP